jgi:hypothetical protein
MEAATMSLGAVGAHACLIAHKGLGGAGRQ